MLAGDEHRRAEHTEEDGLPLTGTSLPGASGCGCMVAALLLLLKLPPRQDEGGPRTLALCPTVVEARTFPLWGLQSGTAMLGFVYDAMRRAPGCNRAGVSLALADNDASGLTGLSSAGLCLSPSGSSQDSTSCRVFACMVRQQGVVFRRCTGRVTAPLPFPSVETRGQGSRRAECAALRAKLTHAARNARSVLASSSCAGVRSNRVKIPGRPLFQRLSMHATLLCAEQLARYGIHFHVVVGIVDSYKALAVVSHSTRQYADGGRGQVPRFLVNKSAVAGLACSGPIFFPQRSK